MGHTCTASEGTTTRMKSKAASKKKQVKADSAPMPKKENPAAILVEAHSQDDRHRAYARTLTRPTVHAAATIYAYEGLEKHGCDVNAFVAELEKQVELVANGDIKRCEAMLVAQAHTLDELFTYLARCAQGNIEAGYLQSADAYLRLAFKAQSQCRTTIEALAEIKNPRPVAFVRQANIAAGPQQVNNGTPAATDAHGSRVRKEENVQSKLLEHQHGERLDTRTTGATIAANQDLATVGEIHGTEDGTGQRAREQECL